MIPADRLIQKFKLIPHPEGGFYKRTFLANDHLFSSILFLLTEGNFSAFHKLHSDEQWNWYQGDNIVIHEIDYQGNYIQTILSPDKENFQYVVKGGHWFASESIGGHGFALCGCTVVPAFDFNHFELAKRDKMILQFPQHDTLVTTFTRINE